jgi:uncharacterized protein YndB with AHSA1/START domain
METTHNTIITITISVNAPAKVVWKAWTNPEHIIKWNAASDDWHTLKAENDLRPGGRFYSRMEAKDGSNGFDFEGIYDEVKTFERIVYTLSDGRKVTVTFHSQNGSTLINETFEAENSNSLELQKDGWKAILNNFKKYVESQGILQTLHFEITIDARPEKVYQTMIDEKNFAVWTTEFNPSSHFEGSWDKGSRILFLGTDQDGNLGGMVSRINENIPLKYISIEHLGIIQKGQEIMEGPETEKWAGAMENYTFTEVDGKTLLSVEMDVNNDLKDYFLNTWPKALNKLKAICEQ